MCESNVYAYDYEEGPESLVLESVDKILPEGLDSWRLVSIFGEQKIIKGSIKSMSLVDHRIVFKRLPG